ncbi:MAG: PEP-CTERM sorting domain-containing protein [Pseudomonadales bacterium]|nr:PEP-CTERM sorting domain-containing protein [Pseudomonadales bacterium]
MTLRRLVFTLAVLCLSQASYAAIITYDLTQPTIIPVNNGETGEDHDDNYYYQQTKDGVTLTAFGYENYPSEGFSDREQVTWGGWGLGVNDDDNSSSSDSYHLLDGEDESILFNIGRAGILTAVQLSEFGDGDDWNLWIDGVEVFVDRASSTLHQSYAFNNWFMISADGDSDVFGIQSVSVSVPEPGTLGLLALGIFALGLQRRRT